MARILMVTSEAAPFAKTGGLADVLGSLPPALVERGEEVAVVLPAYASIDLSGAERIYNELTVWMDGGSRYDCSVERIVRQGVHYLFVNCPPMYQRPGIYGDRHGDFGDNHLRFAVLCRAALAISSRIFRPDVIHCHDWQASLVPVYLKSTFRHDPVFYGIKTLLTIHNLGYQGRFGASVLPDIAVPVQDVMHPEGIEYFGDVNLLKGGIVYSDYITTVSPRYAQEIQTPEFGFGLDPLLRARRFFIAGILNGVDYAEWNPQTDRYLPAWYDEASLAGKLTCKKALLEEFYMPTDKLETRPLLGIVSRFAHQKGLDLVADCIQGIADLGVQMVVLGSGDAALERTFGSFAQARPEQFGYRGGYNEGLAHRIEAGSDMFLMPSRYEPCGLNQIYSLKYGTIPVVRATGGLDDAVTASTGFKFFNSTAHDLYNCIRYATTQFAARESWEQRMRLGMMQDFSWALSAERYAELYRRLRQ
ncbi:MAG TPA: glycogen synthase GlgA [Bryobacteraceae bacterium]